VRVSSFNPADEVGEFTPNPDGNIDYVGSFEFTVVPVIPEPATASIMLSALVLGFTLRRHRHPS
jgi:hypothetical protein